MVHLPLWLDESIIGMQAAAARWHNRCLASGLCTHLPYACQKSQPGSSKAHIFKFGSLTSVPQYIHISIHDLFTWVAGVISICIWGTSPANFVSLPRQNCFISHTISFVSPKKLLHFPNNLSHFPNTFSHFPNNFVSLCPKKLGMISHSKIVLPSCFVVDEENILALRVKLLFNFSFIGLRKR